MTKMKIEVHIDYSAKIFVPENPIIISINSFFKLILGTLCSNSYSNHLNFELAFKYRTIFFLCVNRNWKPAIYKTKYFL